ncbi:hypothetical protein AVDCRST_MAG81-4822, partial [uncultured Synechococcales cyanobacterium]
AGTLVSTEPSGYLRHNSSLEPQVCSNLHQSSEAQTPQARRI